MKACEPSQPRGYLLRGCLYTIPHWLQIVQAKALQAIQPVDCVWNTRHWLMFSMAGIFEQEKQCSCIGEERYCAHPSYIWLRLWWIILSSTNLRVLVGKSRIKIQICNNWL